MGFNEIKHTADWALLIWGENIETLFKEAARGMYALMSAQSSQTPRRIYEFSTYQTNLESQLVSFLSELLYCTEQEELIFDSFYFKLSDGGFAVKMEGSNITSIQRQIKAVTFHNLEIKQSNQGYQVEIVFDV
ncbi:MAG: hypothetical protein A2X25_12325 [Chloroflexi bacterium GWB2_49_20]|nr:MAG: hypothetical protein A2X25_12325 [Chloroflexi bacterium GWB2_49_20]OGN78491.1 MAG: hypothetical protein A2X26_01875 [Chloroflexi bacterium GWC2_49_37]OGN84046.1 MAG: hypothetical protein A2X27_13810 [Chloroflexi bacterium GWD2_49_16]HBG75310.1 protein archease [Anaerolineae bacterium]HCC79056.1 protein archease [Anaerolineae bacterium]